MDYLVYNMADTHLQPLADAGLLSAEERALAARRGGHYILIRSLLRCELARRLGCSPQDIRFRIGEHGKPECEGGGIHFNLSHSGDCLAMAFDDTPIGIDVERMRPRPRMEQLAQRIMSPAQFAAFRERGCAAEEFFACWCAAEALIKQVGGSIWQAGEYPFRYEQGRICVAAGRDKVSAVRLFTPQPGYMGAIASSPVTV